MSFESDANKWWSEMMGRGERVASIRQIPGPEELRFLIQQGRLARVTSEYWILKNPSQTLDDVPPAVFEQVVERILSTSSYTSTFLPQLVKKGETPADIPPPTRKKGDVAVPALRANLRYLALVGTAAATALIAGYSLTVPGVNPAALSSLTQIADASTGFNPQAQIAGGTHVAVRAGARHATNRPLTVGRTAAIGSETSNPNSPSQLRTPTSQHPIVTAALPAPPAPSFSAAKKPAPVAAVRKEVPPPAPAASANSNDEKRQPHGQGLQHSHRKGRSEEAKQHGHSNHSAHSRPANSRRRASSRHSHRESSRRHSSPHHQRD